MSHQRLTYEERCQIYILRKENYTLTKIGKVINRNKSVISRELSRNKGLRGYRPNQAQSKYGTRKKNSLKAIKLSQENKSIIESRLSLQHSPEQISGWLIKVKGISISHQTIYNYIYKDKRKGGVLYKELRQSNKKRRKKYGSKTENKGQIKDRVSIDKRPAEVEKKEVVGHWEGDTIIGKDRKGAILTLVERVTKTTLIYKLNSKNAIHVANSTIKLLTNLKTNVLSITFDNGKEFAAHKIMSKKLKTDVYFAHPYSSWERGLNENTNGLIRQYIPKGTDFKNVTENQIKEIQNKLNNRPRKLLNYNTPKEIFKQVTGVALGT